MRRLLTLAGGLVVLALAAYGAWHLVGPGEKTADMGPFMQPLLEDAAAGAVEAMPRGRMPAALFVPPFHGDVRGLARRAVIGAIEARGRARIIDQASLGERIGGAGTIGAIVKELLGSDPDVPMDARRAREFLQKYSLPGLLWGRASLEETEEEGRVELVLRTLGPEGDTVCEAETRRTAEKSLRSWPYVRSRILAVPLAWRLLAWLVFLVALPFALSPVLVRSLRRESNVRNAATLAALTLVTAFSLWLALAFSGSAWAAVCVGALGAGAGGVYHYLVLDFLEEVRR